MKITKTKHNSGNLNFKPIVRYIILFYIFTLISELFIGSIYSLSTMKKEAGFVIENAKSGIEYRINHTIDLLNTLADDPLISNPDISYGTKAKMLTKYSDALGYMMICIVDKDANVYSEDESAVYLGGRAYMQRLFTTGKLQVTDSFPAGSNGETLNYTIAVPFFKDGKVDGCLFAAIYFDELADMLLSNTYGTYQEIALFGSENQMMSLQNAADYGKTFLDLTQDNLFFNTTAKQVESNMYNKQSGSYWNISVCNPLYTTYQPVENTYWTILCQLSFGRLMLDLLPEFFALFVITTLLCIILVALANRYIKTQMGTVNMLVGSVQELEMKIYKNEKPENIDFNEIISLTSKGLTDGLTGVITRTVFLNQVPNKLKLLSPDKLAALCFVDVDSLKFINDNYGHNIGDMTLKNVGYTLREFEKKYDGLVGRHGGDEFILLLTDFDSQEALDELLEELTLRLHSDVSAGDTVLHTHCSIGVTVCTNLDTDVDLLIKQADEALYSVKQNGKGYYKIYNNK